MPNQPIEEKWKETLKNNFFHPFYSYYTGFGWEKVESREDIPDNYPKGAEVREHLPDEEIERYKELKSFIENILEQERRAFGGCLKCYGKGYSTEHVGETTAFADFGDEFGGDDRKVIAHSMIRMIPCNCERGKQIETLSLTSK